MTTVNVAAVRLIAIGMRNLSRAPGTTIEELRTMLGEYADDLEQTIVTTGDCADHGEHDGPECPACKFIAEERGS